MSKSKTRLYFGKLHEQTRERDLEKFVRNYGKIREISVKRGYGFVEFYDPRDAEDVVYELNGRELLGERVIIEHAREPSSRRDYGYVSYGSRSSSSRSSHGPRDYRRNIPVRTEHRLAVENLSSRINWQELKEIFNKVGEVTFSDAHKRKTGIGIVEFATKDDMKTALKKMDGVELNGKKIKLTVETVRSRSRSRSRSRGHRSRSRSPKRRRHRSRSKSPKRSRSKSPSKTREEKQASKSRSRSRSKSEEAKSRSQSPEKDGEESNRESGHESGNESPNRNGEEEDNANEEDDE